MTPDSPSRESIELRAYQLWEERGRPWGTPETDWLAAERELGSDRPSTSAEDEAPAVVAAKLVGSVLGSVSGVFTSLIETVQSSLEHHE